MPDPRVKASLIACWATIAKTMVGSGLLSLANALAVAGWIVGFAMFIFATIVSALTLRFLSLLADDYMQVQRKQNADKNDSEGKSLNNIEMIKGAIHNEDDNELTQLDHELLQSELSYCAIASRCFPAGIFLADLAIIIDSLGGIIVYLILFKRVSMSLLPLVIKGIDDSVAIPRLIVLAVVVVVAAPCYLREITKTKFINMFGLVCVIYCVILSIVQYGEAETTPETSVLPPSDDPGIGWSILRTWPRFIFTFSCHQNFFLIADKMHNPTIERMSIVALGSIAFGAAVYVFAIVFPYLTYGDAVQDSYLDNMETERVHVYLGFICLLASLISAIPLQVIPARESVIVSATSIAEKYFGIQRPPKNGQIYKMIHFGVTTACILICMLVAMFVTSLSDAFDFLGLITSNTMSLILPSMLYVMTFKNRGHWFDKYAAWSILSLAILSVPLCIAAVLLDAR